MSVRSRRFVAAGLLLGGAAFGGVGACGSRSSLGVDEVDPVPACIVHADCEGFDDRCRNVRCVLVARGEGGGGGEGIGGAGGADLVARCLEVNPVDCDDGDECSIDTCDPDAGTCSYEPAAFDLDEDGYTGPREGYRAGEPGSCGEDCDDANDAAFPGNPEVCDGVDNDCNGVVDDDAAFVPIEAEPVRVSGDVAPAGTSGLMFGGDSYAAFYTGTDGGFTVYRALLSPTGEKVGDGEQALSLASADATGGAVVWTGDRYGVAFQARLEGDYETYLATVDTAGQKFAPPTRLSDALGFSVNSDLAWTGTRFVVVWQDERSGTFDVFGRTVELDGTPSSGEVQLTQPFGGYQNESPVVAASSEGIGLAWLRSDVGTSQFAIQFQAMGFDLAPASDRVDLTDGASEVSTPAIVWNDDSYVVSWFDKSRAPRGIWAAVVDPSGAVIVPARPVSNPPSNAFSRYVSMRPLGDRVLFVYADSRDDNDGYELYGRMLARDLEPLAGDRSDETRLTNAPGDSVYPRAAFGPDGNVGVLFRDDRDGQQHVWFTRLGCLAGGG